MSKKLLDQATPNLLVPLNRKLEQIMYRILEHGISDFEVDLAIKGISWDLAEFMT